MASISSIFGIKTSNSSSKHHPHVLQSTNSGSYSGNSSSSNPSTTNSADDKNLAQLKDLASIGANRNCFDCSQRGPTYVNMTIGSFVCTSCSGKLRGLNPPHRVKAISMATFTNDDIDFLKCRGNEFCQKVWLGRYPAPILPLQKKNESKLLDMLTARYERKTWYVMPNESLYEETRKKNESEILNKKKGLKESNKEPQQQQQQQQQQITQHQTSSTLVNSSVPITLPSPKQPSIVLKYSLQRPHNHTISTINTTKNNNNNTNSNLQNVSSSLLEQSFQKSRPPSNTPQSNNSIDSSSNSLFSFHAVTTGFADFTNFSSSPPPVYSPPNAVSKTSVISPPPIIADPFLLQGQSPLNRPTQISAEGDHFTRQQDKYAALQELSDTFNNSMNINWEGGISQGFSNTNPFVNNILQQKQQQQHQYHQQQYQLLNTLTQQQQQQQAINPLLLLQQQQQQQKIPNISDFDNQQYYLQQQYLHQQQLQQQQILHQQQQQPHLRSQQPHQSTITKESLFSPNSLNQSPQTFNYFNYSGNPYFAAPTATNFTQQNGLSNGCSGFTNQNISNNVNQPNYLFNPSNPFLQMQTLPTAAATYPKTNPFL